MTGPAPDVVHLVVAKAPVPGQVKTRLTPTLSDHQAAALAAAALLDTLDAVRAAAEGGPAPVIALTGDVDGAAAPGALRAALATTVIIAQRGDQFAERLANAHLDAAGPEGAVVQIGMDTPQVDPAVLRSVALRLSDPLGPDAVLGPAVDGGWWLLGLRRARDAQHLVGVPMSRDDTGARTLAALRSAGLRIELTETLTDVDEVTDLAPVAATAPATRFAELVRVLDPLVAPDGGTPA
ncbi:hypothetical protein FHX74_001560 [Friedmanniella endophytica]|uniref:Glycosyltransferase involved in cell wall biogenesis n=1 Tax=Microlunatus kandeliicorticis TaxID=1759536 RepID=A0A7W3IRP0_9ACTN|nr:DUF2064 domain-containing protein [Microlunatus kandeliicorticis]MBA8793955.1 hypothetical protein [Microlunatus kandeliicorticis]